MIAIGLNIRARPRRTGHNPGTGRWYARSSAREEIAQQTNLVDNEEELEGCCLIPLNASLICFEQS